MSNHYAMRAVFLQVAVVLLLFPGAAAQDTAAARSKDSNVPQANVYIPADALRALAGSAVAPAGAEIDLKVFTWAARIRSDNRPDKGNVREITIDRNPFSAEYDRLANTRIETLPRFGAGKIHGGAALNFNDRVLNSRNPYADVRPPSQQRIYTGNLSGPLISDKALFFVSFDKRELDEYAVINATVLNDALSVTNLRRVELTPEKFWRLSPRFDFQLNKTNTVRVGYFYDRSDEPKADIGGRALPARAVDEGAAIQQLNLTEISILSPQVVNETRFQYFRWSRTAKSDPRTQPIVVPDSFGDGGADVTRSAYTQNQFELQNYTTMTLKRHTLRYGGRLRAALVNDLTELKNTYVFDGHVAPTLDRDNRVVLGPDGRPKPAFINGIEVYRRTILFQRLGLGPSEIRSMGGGATRYIGVIGNPFAEVKQVDFGGFIHDDWKLRPDFALSFGLRYQNQTNVHGKLNFAPRAAFVWTPWTDGAGQPRMVIRGGAGVFYDWMPTHVTLEITHFNGINESQFSATDPRTLDFFPNIPPSALLASLPRTIFSKATDFSQPYAARSSLGVEQIVSKKITLSASYLYARGFHRLLIRNINAPLPGSGVRPLGHDDNIIEWQTDGLYRYNSLIVNASVRPNSRISLSAAYAFSHTNSDTDGTFLANPYDLRADYGRAGTDIRHQFTLNGSFDVPWGVTLIPFLTAQSGPPFDIQTGLDNNNDSIFRDRPAFATEIGKPSVIATQFGAFDLAPGPGQRTIPRNFGENPGYFSVNLRISRAFTLSERKAPANKGPNGSQTSRSYKLGVALDAVNILNRTNQGGIVGNLTAASFGESYNLRKIGQRSASNNRTIHLAVSFNF
jgi:hypothetical protein